MNWHRTKHEKYTDIILHLMSSKIVVHRTLVPYTRWAYIVNTWVIWRHSMRPYSLPKLWRYINLILTYLLAERWNMSNSAKDIYFRLRFVGTRWCRCLLHRTVNGWQWMLLTLDWSYFLSGSKTLLLLLLSWLFSKWHLRFRLRYCNLSWLFSDCC